MIKFFKKYHKWIGIIISLLLVLYAVSGIVLNHRKLFSNIDISRSFLPEEYVYNNWNLAAVKGAVEIGKDSILVYGNIGAWLTSNSYKRFTDFNIGFTKGMDNRKICKIYKTQKGKIWAGTLFGLFEYDTKLKKWQKTPIDLHNPRIVDVTGKQDTLLVLTRSYLLKSTDGRNFSKHTLPPPVNYDNKIGLFKTLWVVHSGEIYGEAGKLFVDLIGLIFTFLTITGIILFINYYVVRNRKKKNKDRNKIKKISRWNLKWHNKIGWITLVFLIITTITGMFLRPPLLIAIADSKVGKIPYTILDTDNAWFDKLRRIIYDEQNNRFYIATNEGVYFSDDNFKTELIPANPQPPISVMGVNVFEKKSDDELLIGSFEGLFVWNVKTNEVYDYIEKKPYVKPPKKGAPLGDYLITGLIRDSKGAEIYFDFNKGAKSVDGTTEFVKMPDVIRKQPMSLWNVMLEIHTARIFQSLIGIFYILIVPLTGLLTLFVLISGFIVWYKKHRNNKTKRNKK